MLHAASTHTLDLLLLRVPAAALKGADKQPAARRLYRHGDDAPAADMEDGLLLLTLVLACDRRLAHDLYPV